MGAKHCMGTIDKLRAELAAAKETITRYETTAENCDVLRAELASIKAQEPTGWYTEDHLDDKSATTYSWAVAERWVEKGWPVSPLYAAPVAKPAPIPDADHSEDVRTMVVPDGYKLVPIEPTAAQCFTAAFNLCNEFGDEFVRDNKQFAMAAYRSLVAASPSAKGGE